jgi:hypothetical protein
LDGRDEIIVKRQVEPNQVSTKTGAAPDREAPKKELDPIACSLSSDALEFEQLMNELNPILAQCTSLSLNNRTTELIVQLIRYIRMPA